MNLALVFSRDRALQLEAALTSFFRHGIGAAELQVVVLYLASATRHQAQYDELARQYGNTVRFVREEGFRRQLLGLLGVTQEARPSRPLQHKWDHLRSRLGRPSPTGSRAADNVLFLVDDALFVRPLRLAVASEALEANPDALGFSWRLGINTRYCYVLGRQQELPPFEPAAADVLKYNWTKADGDFGYPLEISSSMYRLEMIKRLLSDLSFSDPNTLESQMSLQRRRFARRQPLLLCLEQSAAFSAPLNRVQQIYENRAGTASDLSPESLADMFDRGWRINVRELDGFVPSACHQEVELVFEQRIG